MMADPSEPSESVGAAPVFSLLIAAHDAEDTLAATLDSLRAQTFASWQACVVDDGSRDTTSAIAADYAKGDERITVAIQDNRGAAAARNAAARVARGTWLLPLDADDLLLPDALERQAAFIEVHPGYDLYSWGVWLQSPDGSRMPWSVSARYRQTAEFDLAQLVEGNLLTVMTVISAERFGRLGGFRDVHLEDYDLWLRALAGGARHLHNPELLAVYRLDPTGKNADVSKRWLGTAEVLDALADDSAVEASVRRVAMRRARYWRAVEERRSLEVRLVAGEYAGARGYYLRARPAYASGLKWLAAAPAMFLSPRVFVALTHPEPITELPSVE